jgi:Secretion system C-terminal sorting domain
VRLKFLRQKNFFMNKIFIYTALMCCASLNVKSQVKILFDATKAEMAGNADWVIDADLTNLGVGSGGAYLTSSGHQSNPQQIPTPAQSTITTSTTETYWTGALSSWGIDAVNKGYTVETLPWNGQITYGSTSNAQDLSHYKVFVVDEPNIVFTMAEKSALLQFVQNGGGLFIISDHNNSDRNGDGWDSPHIWNDFFTNNGSVSNPFGISFDLLDFSQTTTNLLSSSSDSILHGPMGNVTKAQWSGGTTMTLYPSINPTIKGVVFTSGSAIGSTNVMVAYGHYGSGKIAAMGDSSPTDDGTGNPTCTLYNGYWSDASGNHRPLIMNMTIWLATAEFPTTVTSFDKQKTNISVIPNPSSGNQFFTADNDLTDAIVTVTDVAGKIVLQQHYATISKGEPIYLQLNSGFYLLSVTSNNLVTTAKVVVY